MRFLLLLALVASPVFASGTEAPLMDFGTAQQAAPLPAQATFDVSAMPHWLQLALMILGAVVPVASFVANYLDVYAKAKVSRGEKVPAWLEAFGAATHGAGANPRKAMKLAKSAVAKAREP